MKPILKGWWYSADGEAWRITEMDDEYIHNVIFTIKDWIKRDARLNYPWSEIDLYAKIDELFMEQERRKHGKNKVTQQARRNKKV